MPDHALEMSCLTALRTDRTGALEAEMNQVQGRGDGVSLEAGGNGEKDQCVGLIALRMEKLQDWVIIQVSILQIRQET